jgi:hypothetical protein
LVGLRSRSVILAGEAVACDDHGMASFDRTVGQNVGKRFGLFQKADCDRLGDRVARGCLACVRVAGIEGT